MICYMAVRALCGTRREGDRCNEMFQWLNKNKVLFFIWLYFWLNGCIFPMVKFYLHTYMYVSVLVVTSCHLDLLLVAHQICFSRLLQINPKQHALNDNIHMFPIDRWYLSNIYFLFFRCWSRTKRTSSQHCNAICSRHDRAELLLILSWKTLTRSLFYTSN